MSQELVNADDLPVGLNWNEQVAVIGFLLVPWNGHRRSLSDDDTHGPARAPHRAGDALNAG